MRRRTWIGFAGGTVALFLLTAGAEPDTIRVLPVVESAVVKVGERVGIRIAMPLPDSTARLVGPPAPLALGDIDVVVSEPQGAGGDSAGWRLEIALFRPGEHDLAGFALRLETRGGTVPVELMPYRISTLQP